jgi:hypothetical protein
MFNLSKGVDFMDKILIANELVKIAEDLVGAKGNVPYKGTSLGGGLQANVYPEGVVSIVRGNTTMVTLTPQSVGILKKLI